MILIWAQQLRETEPWNVLKFPMQIFVMKFIHAPANYLPLGLFYKYFKYPIELFYNPSSGGASTFNYINADKAYSFGAELEFRKRLDFSDA